MLHLSYYKRSWVELILFRSILFVSFKKYYYWFVNGIWWFQREEMYQSIHYISSLIVLKKWYINWKITCMTKNSVEITPKTLHCTPLTENINNRLISYYMTIWRIGDLWDLCDVLVLPDSSWWSPHFSCSFRLASGIK